MLHINCRNWNPWTQYINGDTWRWKKEIWISGICWSADQIWNLGLSWILIFYTLKLNSILSSCLLRCWELKADRLRRKATEWYEAPFRRLICYHTRENIKYSVNPSLTEGLAEITAQPDAWVHAGAFLDKCVYSVYLNVDISVKYRTDPIQSLIFIPYCVTAGLASA